LSPQHTTAPLPVWRAQTWNPPAEIAAAVPATPFTKAGGTGANWPQHTTACVDLWMAQPWSAPAEIAAAPPSDDGTSDCPYKSSPQQMTALLPLWIAQL
jgi:hypothetical protein